MLRHQNPAHRQTRDIRILQINTQRSPRVHAAALQLAFANDIEMICVQEPWINRDAETDAEVQRRQTHPRYDIFAPLGAWTMRPRTMIYVRKDLEASQKLLEDEEHPDVCSHPTHEPRPSRRNQHIQCGPWIGKNK
jgi:hypothetical protein